MRFNMRVPGTLPAEIAAQYQTAIEMAQWADDKGCASIGVSEHHAAVSPCMRRCREQDAYREVRVSPVNKQANYVIDRCLLWYKHVHLDQPQIWTNLRIGQNPKV